MTTDQRHNACGQLARARKSHVGLAKKFAEPILQQNYNFYQTFSDGDLLAMCKAKDITIA